jgi:hypothetical protein
VARKQRWLRDRFKKIESAAEAREAAKEVAIVFYFIAGMQALFFLVFGGLVLIDAAAYALLGFWLHQKMSRVAAVLLLFMSLMALVATGANRFDGEGGRNIILAIMVVGTSIRAAQATFKFAALEHAEMSPTQAD